MKKDAVIIGIAGASGSGKTLVARNLCQAFRTSEVAIIQEDAYYKDLAHMSLEERARVNFDHPDAFDHNFLREQISTLKSGMPIENPEYDYAAHTRKPGGKTVHPSDILILEGILILAIPELRELMDIKIFIDTDPDVCLIRRVRRDTEERGRSLESVLRQYEETVRPMYLQFVEPSKRYADIIIPRGGKNVIAIDIVKSKIEKLLAG